MDASSPTPSDFASCFPRVIQARREWVSGKSEDLFEAISAALPQGHSEGLAAALVGVLHRHSEPFDLHYLADIYSRIAWSMTDPDIQMGPDDYPVVPPEWQDFRNRLLARYAPKN